MIKQINEANFTKEVLEQEKATVLKVFTESCPKCKAVEAVFEQLADEKKEEYIFTEWNVKSQSEILKKYKVVAVPSFLFFKNGILIHRKIGVISSNVIYKCLKKINKLDKNKAKSKELKGLIDWSFLKFWE